MKKILNQVWILLIVVITVSLFISCNQKESSDDDKMANNKELKVWKIPNIDNGAEFIFLLMVKV